MDIFYDMIKSQDQREELMKIYKKYREFENFMAWAKQEFGYLIPQEYLNFLEKEKNVEKM